MAKLEWPERGLLALFLGLTTSCVPVANTAPAFVNDAVFLSVEVPARLGGRLAVDLSRSIPQDDWLSVAGALVPDKLATRAAPPFVKPEANMARAP